jgi:hypothetical protein
MRTLFSHQRPPDDLMRLQNNTTTKVGPHEITKTLSSICI